MGGESISWGLCTGSVVRVGETRIQTKEDPPSSLSPPPFETGSQVAQADLNSDAQPRMTYDLELLHFLPPLSR